LETIVLLLGEDCLIEIHDNKDAGRVIVGVTTGAILAATN
jgi:hypothetical protein